jgi:hypothetical protein
VTSPTMTRCASTMEIRHCENADGGLVANGWSDRSVVTNDESLERERSVRACENRGTRDRRQEGAGRRPFRLTSPRPEGLTGRPGQYAGRAGGRGYFTAGDNVRCERAAVDSFQGPAPSSAHGAEPCAVPLHGEGPGHASRATNFRRRATSAHRGARGTVPCRGAAVRGTGAGAEACRGCMPPAPRDRRTGASSARARGQGIRRGCTPKAPGSARRGTQVFGDRSCVSINPAPAGGQSAIVGHRLLEYGPQ